MGLFNPKTNWEIGDTAWIHGIGDPCENPRTSGKIVHAFTLPGWCAGTIHYVVEIETSMDPLLEVRQATSMWAAPEFYEGETRDDFAGPSVA